MELRGWLKKIFNAEQDQRILYDFSGQPEIIELRDQIDKFISSKVQNKDYFSISLSNVDSEKILNWERNMIQNSFNLYYRWELESKCTSQQTIIIREQLLEKAELMHELRTKGADFSPEKMERLAKLMQNSKSSKGINQLGRINAKLGLIKQGAEVIFPEYEQQCKELGEIPLKSDLGELNKGNKNARDNYVFVAGPLKIKVAITQEKLKQLRKIAEKGGSLKSLSALEQYLVNKYKETGKFEEETRLNLADYTSRAASEQYINGSSYGKQQLKELIRRVEEVTGTRSER